MKNAIKDMRIGELCREGKTIFYAYIDGEYFERRTIEDMEQVLEINDKKKAAIVTETTESLFERRIALAWIIGSNTCDYTLVMNNRIEDAATRYSRLFKFKKIRGVVHSDDFVQFGNMGFGLDCAGPELREAIRIQTGI